MKEGAKSWRGWGRVKDSLVKEEARGNGRKGGRIPDEEEEE